MATTIKTVLTHTCDICQSICELNDSVISIKVSSGDRDVGPSTITGKLSFYQPYATAQGIICKACKIKWLSIYLKELK